MTMRVRVPVADLCATPDGARERQALLGTTVVVEERTGDWLRVRSGRDGYPGWIRFDALAEDLAEPTHRVTAIRSYAKPAPGTRDTTAPLFLPFGARLTVLATDKGWSTVELGDGRPLFMPAMHLGLAGQRFDDPVAVAELFLGTPYLWGGNSAFGIDCSGLVQASCHACSIDCPGDSGPQARAMGETLPIGTPPRRGDLMFWKGHVAWVSDPDTLLHANGHSMSVAHEPIRAALARIEAAGEGPMTRHARLTRDT